MSIPVQKTLRGEVRLSTARDALSTSAVQPSIALTFGGLSEEDQKRFLNTNVFTEKQPHFIKLIQDVRESEQTHEDADQHLLEKLGRHIPNSPDKKNWQCGVKGCKYQDTKQHLLAHLRGQSHIDMQMFACDQCHLRFYHPHDRKRHERTQHSDQNSDVAPKPEVQRSHRGVGEPSPTKRERKGKPKTSKSKCQDAPPVYDPNPQSPGFRSSSSENDSQDHSSDSAPGGRLSPGSQRPGNLAHPRMGPTSGSPVTPVENFSYPMGPPQGTQPMNDFDQYNTYHHGYTPGSNVQLQQDPSFADPRYMLVGQDSYSWPQSTQPQSTQPTSTFNGNQIAQSIENHTGAKVIYQQPMHPAQAVQPTIMYDGMTVGYPQNRRKHMGQPATYFLAPGIAPQAGFQGTPYNAGSTTAYPHPGGTGTPSITCPSAYCSLGSKELEALCVHHTDQADGFDNLPIKPERNSQYPETLSPPTCRAVVPLILGTL